VALDKGSAGRRERGCGDPGESEQGRQRAQVFPGLAVHEVGSIVSLISSWSSRGEVKAKVISVFKSQSGARSLFAAYMTVYFTGTLKADLLNSLWLYPE
jgi:hypothetical protein